LDHRYFDASNDTIKLKLMHKYIQSHFDDPSLPPLLRVLLKSNCTTAHGVRYKVEGTVCSGDVTTSDGNSTLNEMVLLHMTRNCKKRALCPVNGDDSCVFHERSDSHHISDSLKEDYGYSTKSSFVYEFEDIEYCQCHPVLTVNGWLMVRTPQRVFDRTTVNLDDYSGDKLLKWFATVGECESSCNKGVPILQSYANFLRRFHKRVLKHIDKDLEYHRIDISELSTEITDECRVSFYKAFNILPSVQIAHERYYDSLTNTLNPCKQVDLPSQPTMDSPYV